MLSQENKEEIVEKLKIHIQRIGSQNAAANSLKGVSSAVISHALNNKWNHIRDEKWRQMNAQLDCPTGEWVGVNTRDYELLSEILEDARSNSGVFGIVGSAGSGKTFTLRDFTRTNTKTYLLSCNEFWNKKHFLSELLAKMGKKYKGMTVAEMVSEVTIHLNRTHIPLIILDEADKLKDEVLSFFITFYNELEGQCGFVLIATDFLKKRIHRGLTSNKRGYEEIYSRIGRKFIELNGVGYTDVQTICYANGVRNKTDVRTVFEDSENDLRRVKRKIHALKLQMQDKAA